MTFNSFNRNLKKHSLVEINPLDQVYDPDRHTVKENYEDKNKVKTIISNLFQSKKSNVVGKVHSVGYVFNNKTVLRKANVSVVRNIAKKVEEPTEKDKKTTEKKEEQKTSGTNEQESPKDSE